MFDLALSVPVAARKLLDAIATCTKETVWTRYPDGEPATYLHPQGKVIFQGVVNPGDTRSDGSKWQGEKPLYLVVYNQPRNKPGMCDAHWFNMDVLEVQAVPVVESLPKCKE